jgi:hypothetical protein
MIISASYKTDIPAFHARWFAQRLAAGWAEMKNPYSAQRLRVDLTPEGAEGFIFWTRHVGPFWGVLEDLSQAARPFVVQYTLTGYPRALERSVIGEERAIAEIRALSDRFGAASVVWRYDPVVLSSLTPADWHRETFARLSAALHGVVDEVIVSALTVYAKTRRNLDRAAQRNGFDWSSAGTGVLTGLLADLADTARDRGQQLTLCAQGELRAALESRGTPVRPAACIDATRLATVRARHAAVGAEIPRRKAAQARPDCRCAASRDIGAYDTCAHGCVYCYAVRDHDRVKAGVAAMDPAAPSLEPGDRIG